MRYLLIYFLAIMLFISCQTAPEKIENEPAICFQFRDCSYRNKDNKDKSLCVQLRIECANYSRFEYCKKDSNRPPDMRFQECWDKLK